MINRCTLHTDLLRPGLLSGKSAAPPAFRSTSAIDLQAAQRASVRAQYAAAQRARAAAGTGSIRECSRAATADRAGVLRGLEWAEWELSRAVARPQTVIERLLGYDSCALQRPSGVSILAAAVRQWTAKQACHRCTC